jgi:SPP1 gp7 family putative phage head morphogenesis protein
VSKGVFFLVNSIDPTRTLTLRNRFVSDFNSRFAQLMADIREAIIDKDVFGLQPRRMVMRADVQPREFDFPLMSDKIDAFTIWLQRKNKQYLLSGGRRGVQTVLQPQSGADYRTSWMNTYIDAAYRQGIKRGRQEMKKAGLPVGTEETLSGRDPISIAFATPIHADRVGLIYSRAYTSLQGITSAMESTVSDTLAIGMAEGRHPRELARMLNQAITGQGGTLAITDKLGRFIPAKRRAQVLARTETIRAHHAANMGEYRAAGLEGVTVLAEHLTAGDNRVCPQCSPLNGKKYSLDEAEYAIPVHPQCRCVAIPWIPETEEDFKELANART